MKTKLVTTIRLMPSVCMVSADSLDTLQRDLWPSTLINPREQRSAVRSHQLFVSQMTAMAVTAVYFIYCDRDPPENNRLNSWGLEVDQESEQHGLIFRSTAEVNIQIKYFILGGDGMR